MSGGSARAIEIRAGKYLDERSEKWTAAEARALRQYLADLPHPLQYAQHLPLRAAQALKTAAWGGPERGFFVLAPEARILAPLGLCEVGQQRHHYLGEFGFSVLKALEGMDV